jgi:ABC-type multidrug transport system fused ATPase/permease subunit
MKTLFNIAFRDGKNRWLFGLIIASMILATIASQLEVFAIGLIAQKGPDFFELFAPAADGAFQASDSVSYDAVRDRWSAIASSPSAPITKEEASAYLMHHKPGGIMHAFYAVDQVLQIRKNLTHLALFLLAIALFKAVTLFLHRYSTRLASIRVSASLRQHYFEHIQTLPMSFYQKYNMGSLSSRVVGDASTIAEALNACLVNYLQTPFTVLSTLILCFLTSWQLTLLIFIGFPLILLPIAYLARGVKRISKQIQSTQEKFASVLLDFIGGIQTVKIFAMENFSLKKYQEHNLRMAALEKKSARYDLSSRPVVHTLAMAFLSIALVYGLYVLHMQVAAVLFYCGMLYLFYEPIKKFAEENSHIQRGIAAAERMLEVMALKPEIKDMPGAVALPSFSHQVEFDQVFFGYGENWVLKGVSFTVEKGQKVALVGPTGSGKSTLVQLLPRLYDVQKGEIRIDGKPIAAYTQASLRSVIAFVPQRPFLFMDTISANISYGLPYSQKEIEEAAHKAHAAEFIEQLPEKYKSVILEGGKNFSGGQQQRLAIARALIKKAPILIMDEATSSLDALSENFIKQALHQLKGQFTQILIAHRLSTIEDADKIIYLDQGMKIDEGSKDELLLRCPPFRRVWELLHQENA